MLKPELIDYTKCHEYARSLCGSYGIPECDVADIGSDAFLLSIRRGWRADPGENEETVAKRIMYTSVVDIIRRRNRKSLRILSDAEELYRTNSGDGAPSDDEIVEERFTANDQNSVGETVAEHLDWQNPFWLRLFESERQKLRDEKKADQSRKTKKSPFAKVMLRVVSLGLKDSRLRLVREKLNLSGTRFQEILNLLKIRFALCFQALCDWRS